MTVQDTRLETYATCPMGSFVRTTDVLEGCAEDLARWTALEAFNGRLVPLATLRKKFVSLWNDRWPENATRDGERYWAGVRAGRSAAARLWSTFDKYVVLRPVQPYELPVGEHTLVGEYAIIGRRRPDPRVQDGPYVLVTHPYRPITFSRPNLTALARWKHAMMGGEYLGLGIYHLPLLRGAAWREKTIREPLVQPWLASILDAIHRTVWFPAPSGYCTSCVGKACMKVFIP